MLGNYLIQMIKLTRAHIGIAVLPSFWLGALFALTLGYSFNIAVFLLGFLIIFLIYASASYANDFYDFKADQYNRQFGFSGGSGVLQKYPELRQVTKWSALGLIVLSIVLTMFLATISFVPLWSIGFIALGGFFSWFYSAPPLKFSYRGMSEAPHFVAGIMNTAWGYMLLTGTIDVTVLIFAVPLSLHLLNVILIFEIPDREADIHGGKKNIIVSHGRERSYLLITILFWLATLYYLVLAVIGWNASFINFWLLAAFSFIPTLFATYVSFKKPVQQTQATRFAIRTALSLFAVSIIFLIYFVYLQV